MCGIVGIYLKNEALNPELGRLLAAMLIEMSDRGPDSAGIALYRDPVPDSSCKLTLYAEGSYDWNALQIEMAAHLSADVELNVHVRGLNTRARDRQIRVRTRRTAAQIRRQHPARNRDLTGQVDPPGRVLSVVIRIPGRLLRPVVEKDFIEDVSVASGNIVLADHGRTIAEELGTVPEPTLFLAPTPSEDRCDPAERQLFLSTHEIENRLPGAKSSVRALNSSTPISPGSSR